MSDLITDTELADRFGIEVKKLHELRKAKGWPCVRLGRFAIRFTTEQVEQIVALHTEAPAKATPRQVPAVAGQTKASAARRRSA